MPRQARIVAADYPHHVVHRGNNRQAVFFEEKDYKYYLDLLEECAPSNNCLIHAFCLMPNHVHLLITPQVDSALGKLMQKVGLRFAQFINIKYCRSGHLWGNRYFSSLIEKDRYLWAVCRYIDRNPVRARLANDPSSYVWSSAKGTLLGQGPAWLTPVWTNNKDRELYRDFLLEGEDDHLIGQIRAAIQHGMPLGNEAFIKRMCPEEYSRIGQRRRGRPRNQSK